MIVYAVYVVREARMGLRQSKHVRVNGISLVNPIPPDSTRLRLQEVGARVETAQGDTGGG